MNKGYVHVYTGNGKGKTTAAFGLAVRAVCAGKKIFIGQFVKGMNYSELKIVEYVPNLEIEQFGRGCFIYDKPDENDIKLAQKGLERCKTILKEGQYDLVILDEINIAMYFKLLSVDEVSDMLINRANHTEVILTGRYAPEEIINMADLVTEMKEIKHYYTGGVEAREGIEF